MSAADKKTEWPMGFRSAGVAAGVKRDGSLDMALIVSDRAASAAGVFTTNQVCAAPVKVCRAHLEQPVVRAIVMNSGVANACTGSAGMVSAEAMAAGMASELGCLPEEVLVCSTGKIGPQLPMEAISGGVSMLSAAAAADQLEQTSRAMMTTDTRPKAAMRDVDVKGVRVRLTGLAKGAGMIEPNMATMLAFVTTDAAVEAVALQAVLKGAVDRSFNRITVDGDQSTNDSVLMLANGASGVVLEEGSESWAGFVAAVESLCFELAMMIVHDGEGADRFVTVLVEGAESDAAADAAARAVANSLLNKTAWAGTFPDWGRIMDAIGYSAARVDETLVRIWYGETLAVEGGVQAATAMETLVEAVSERELLIRIGLGLGSGEAVVYTCNCTEEYVRINF